MFEDLFSNLISI
jgi:hypothetical protein